MNHFSPAQQKQVQTWTDTRDALLGEIGTLSSERDTLQKEANTQALRLTDIHLSVANAEGRLSVLERLEETKKCSVSIDLAELIARKSRLESEVAEQEAKLKGAKSEYETILVATKALLDSHGIVKDQTDAIKSILSEVKVAALDHLSEAKVIIATMQSASDEVIARSDENLSQTKIILEKLPKYVFELQRPIPIRRTYPKDHPNDHLGIVKEDNENKI